MEQTLHKDEMIDTNNLRLKRQNVSQIFFYICLALRS